MDGYQQQCLSQVFCFSAERPLKKTLTETLYWITEASGTAASTDVYLG